MASKKSKKYKSFPKSYKQKRLQGKKEMVFYYDRRSEHPFVSQSKQGNLVYGHNITHSPSLNPDGSIKKKYRKFKTNPNPIDKEVSYFDTTLEMLDNTPKGEKKSGRLRRKKGWVLSKRNKKALKTAEKQRLKKVHRARR